MQLNHLYALTPVYRRLQDYGPPSEYVRESKKRRRSLTPSEADESDDVNTNEDDDGEKSPKEAHPARVISSLSALTAEQAAQYRVAGLTPEEKIPPRPFPVADFPLRKTSVLEEATKQLSDLKTPLHNPPNYSNTRGKEREKHLGVVNTIMHHMLLKGDYQRAGRAWGMILRASSTGTDLRRLGRWGIGAEILLRRRGNDSDSLENSPSEEPEGMFSEQGFELAKAYYEKLVIEHPYRQNTLNPVRSNFYPALFSCWIYQVTERVRLSKLRAKGDHERDDPDYEHSGSEREHSLSSGRGDHELKRQLQLIRERELEDAQAIADRFDIIIDSPPHDQNAELLRLRGMISQWIANLLGYDGGGNGDSSESEEDEDLDAKAMYGRTGSGVGREAERQAHLERAEDMLSRAQMVNSGLGDAT